MEECLFTESWRETQVSVHNKHRTKTIEFEGQETRKTHQAKHENIWLAAEAGNFDYDWWSWIFIQSIAWFWWRSLEWIPLSTADTSMVAQPLPGFIQNVKNNSIYIVKWCCSANTYISLLSLCDHLFPIAFFIAVSCLFLYRKKSHSYIHNIIPAKTNNTTSSYKQLAKMSAGSSALIPPSTLICNIMNNQKLPFLWSMSLYISCRWLAG